MARIKIIYLSVNGRFRTRWGKINFNFPTAVRNPRDNMTHPVAENPIFTENQPIKFNTFAELSEAGAPVPAPNDWSKQVMICEDNFAFPVTSTASVDWGERAQNREIVYEHGKQLARHRAIAGGLRDMSTGFLSIAVFGTIAIVAVLLALVVIDLKWGGG